MFAPPSGLAMFWTFFKNYIMTNSKLILLSVLFIFLSSCSKESKISMTAMFEINSKNYSQTLQNNILKAGQAYRDFSKPLIPQNLTVGGVNYKISKREIMSC